MRLVRNVEWAWLTFLQLHEAARTDEDMRVGGDLFKRGEPERLTVQNDGDKFAKAKRILCEKAL